MRAHPEWKSRDTHLNERRKMTSGHRREGNGGADSFSQVSLEEWNLQNELIRDLLEWHRGCHLVNPSNGSLMMERLKI